MRIVGILIFSFMCSLGMVARADSIPDQLIDEVKVSVSVKPSVIISTVPLQVLSSQDIKRTGMQSLADAVRQFSGVVVKDFGGVGGLKTVAIRGIGSEHTAVLYDGISLSNAQSGQIDLSKYSLENIALLSLNIGQSDNIFRTAKSFASVGVLNIETVKPYLGDRNHTGQLQLKTGSWGYFSPYLYYGYKINDNYSFSLDGNWQRSDGNFPYEFRNGQETENRKRHNTDVDMWRTEINFFGQPTEKQSFDFKLYYFDSERGLPGYVVIGDPRNSYQRLWDKDFFSQVNYVNKINNKINFNLKSKYSHYYTSFKDGKNPSSDTRYRQDEVYLSGIMLYTPFRDFQFALAEDISYNTMTATYKDFVHPDRYSSWTAFTAKYETYNIIAIANLLGTYISEKTEYGDSPKDKKRFSPAFSVSYKPFEMSNLHIRASYKNVFRTPTFNELYYKKMGNINIEPEKSNQYNIGLTWSYYLPVLLDYIRFTADAYYNDVTDKIITYPTTFEPIVRNLGEVEIKGIDISLESRLKLNNKVALYLAGNYTYQKAIDKTVYEGNKHYKDQIPYTPVHSGAASVSIENPCLNISYSLIASGETYSLPQHTEANRIKSYTDHTLSANKTFNFNTYELRIQGEIINLTGNNYEIIKGYPMPGRSFRLSLNINF